MLKDRKVNLLCKRFFRVDHSNTYKLLAWYEHNGTIYSEIYAPIIKQPGVVIINVVK